MAENFLQDNMNRIKHKIVVLSGKGGVGKSTVAVNTAFALALQGKKVGLLDADIHGPSLAKMLGMEGIVPPNDNGTISPIEVYHNIWALSVASFASDADEPFIWRGPVKMTVLKQFLEEILWPELDYLIVDCPPGTGDEPLSVIQLINAPDGAIIVSTPQDVALLDVRKSIRFSQKLNVPILGLMINMAFFKCPHCEKEIVLFHGEGALKAAHDYNLDILAELPFDPYIGQSGDSGRPYIYDYAKLPAAEAMTKASAKIIALLEK